MPRPDHLGKKLVEVVRVLTPSQIAELLSSLPTNELAKVRKKLRIKHDLDGSEAAAAKLRLMLLTGARQGWPTAFAEVVTERPRLTAMRVLGDRFDTPDEDDARRAIMAVVEEHGPTLASIWVALILSSKTAASTHILKVCSEIDTLEAIINGKTSEPKVHTAGTLRKIERKDRSEQRHTEREQRRKKRANDARSRSNNKRITRHNSSIVEEVPTPPLGAANEIEQERLAYPHLGRYPNADAVHEMVGLVVNTFILFTSSPAEGKFRPAVVLAVEPRRLIVKPLYSEPNFGAGHWRAIEIIDWYEAGLRKKSWAGDEIHRVRRASEPIGRLTLSDWNRVCRGEVNNS